MNVSCHYCGCKFSPQTGWRRCYGWERVKGSSDTVLRKPYRPEMFACHPCVDGLRNGRSPQQGGFDLTDL